MRIVVAGIPRAGKTTLANRLAKATNLAVTRTDDFKDLGWSEQSTVAAVWSNNQKSGILEGVATVRGLRKWLAANDTGLPAEKVYWLSTPRVQPTEEQARMGRGAETIMREIAPELLNRGVSVVLVGADGSETTMKSTDTF